MSLFFLTLSSRPRALKPHKLQKSILWHTVVNTDVCMDLFVFVSKQCSIAEPSGWPWREREREIYIYIYIYTLCKFGFGIPSISMHVSSIIHRPWNLYKYKYKNIYICTFVVSLKIGKMMVVIDIYICVYITCSINICIYISHRHNNVSKKSLNLGLVSISMHVLPIIHRPSNLCIYVHLLFPLRLGKWW